TIYFFFYCSGPPRALHSFPTRRSSDLRSPRESVMVLPQLSDSRAASSSAFFSTRSASLNISRPRSAASIVFHGPDSSACRAAFRSEEHTSELQSRRDLVCRLLLEKKKK